MRSRKIKYLKGTRDFDLPFSNGLGGNLEHFCCKSDGLILSLFNKEWTPTIYDPIGKIKRDSEDWVNNLWENKYWSCC